jgi:hypothetical protein
MGSEDDAGGRSYIWKAREHSVKPLDKIIEPEVMK